MVFTSKMQDFHQIMFGRNLRDSYLLFVIKYSKLNPRQNARQQMRRTNQSKFDDQEQAEANSESNSDDHNDRQWKHNAMNTKKHNPSKNRGKERTRVKTQHWDYEQILKIFTLHEEFGSQWKYMQAQFIERSANSIKNRFYTVIRTFLKLLFRYHDGIVDKLPHQISSKKILKFYESREQFAQFNDLGKKILKKIEYNLESKQLKKLVAQNKQPILQVYELIFNKKVQLQPSIQLIAQNQRKKSKSEGYLSHHDSMQQSVNRRSPKSSPVPSSTLKIEKTEAIFANEPGLQFQQSYPSFMLLVPVFGFMSNAQIGDQGQYSQFPHFF